MDCEILMGGEMSPLLLYYNERERERETGGALGKMERKIPT